MRGKGDILTFVVYVFVNSAIEVCERLVHNESGQEKFYRNLTRLQAL